MNPPSSISCVRDLTLIAHTFCRYSVLIETSSKDHDYNLLKAKGAMDFIDDILSPGEEAGYRVDSDFVYSPTICVVSSINRKNLSYVLSCIGFKRFTFSDPDLF